jgi:hypothetical protein
LTKPKKKKVAKPKKKKVEEHSMEIESKFMGP